MQGKKTIPLSILLLTSIFAVNVELAASITWSAEVNRLTTDSCFDGSPSITQLDNDLFLLVWTKEVLGNNTLYYKTSTDLGTSWSREANLTALQGEGDDMKPSITQLADGKIFVVWSSNRPIPSPPLPDFSMSASPESLVIPQGGSDTSTITIASLNNFAEPVSLRVIGEPPGVTTDLDPDQVTPPPNGNATSILTVSVEATASLGNYMLSVIGRGGNETHSVTVDLEIIASGAFGSSSSSANPSSSEEETGNFELYYKTSSDYGTSWSSDRRLTNSPAEDLSPSVVQLTNDTIFVVWQSNRSGNPDIFCKSSSDGGTSWFSETQLTTYSGFDKCPSVMQAKDGRIWVLWASTRTGNYEIHYKTYDGFAWSAAARLTYTAENDTWPSILQTANGTILVFWSSRGTSPTATGDIYYTYSCDNGDTWSESVQFTTDNHEDTWPSATEMGDMRIWAVWTSDRGDQPDGNWDLYYRTSIGSLYVDITPQMDAEYWAYNPITTEWDGPYSPGYLDLDPYAAPIANSTLRKYTISMPKVKGGETLVVYAGSSLFDFSGDLIAPGTRIDSVAGEVSVPGHPESGPILTYELYIVEGGTVTAEYHRAGPKVDVWRELVIRSPDDQLIGIKTGVIDFLPDMIRPADIEDLGAQTPPYTVTDAPGFHMGHVGFNLRLPVLDDVAFRHACLTAYPQDDIIASIYEYTVTPVRSLIPPVIAGWSNPSIPAHPYNHGNMSDPPGTESFFGIMYEAGYTYHGLGYGDLDAYWETPEGDPIPAYVMWTPTYEVAPTSAEHGARIMDEWHRCGLNTLVHEPADFNWYTGKVFDEQDFAIYMMSWDLEKLLGSRARFPDFLYDLCHSSQDVPGAYNAPGIHDPVLDPWLETLKFGLDHEAKLTAAFNAQAWLYNEDNPWAFPYLQMYSRVLFNGFRPELGGIVNSAGYGADNSWTLYNIHWETGDGLRPVTGDNMVIYCNGETVENINPLQASTVYEWNVISPTISSLIQVDPYTHKDIPWVATSWEIEGPWSGTAPNGVPIVAGMKVSYELRKDVFWQDGNPFTAHDAVFSLEFFRDNAIPRYTAAWEPVVDVVANDDYNFTIYADRTGQFYLYDWADLATLLPPQVWAHMDGRPLSEILAYEVWTNTTDTGPWSTPTQLFGLGPMVFQGYDEVGMVADLTRFEGWFKTTDELEQMTVDMFHAVGDCAPPDYDHRTDPAAFDGEINDDDQTVMSLSFGYFHYEAEFAVHADIDEDNFVGGSDTAMLSFYYGRSREYGPST